MQAHNNVDMASGALWATYWRVEPRVIALNHSFPECHIDEVTRQGFVETVENIVRGESLWLGSCGRGNGGYG